MADAGGGTLDISSYAIRGTSPLVIEEIAPPDCTSALLPSFFFNLTRSPGLQVCSPVLYLSLAEPAHFSKRN